MSWSDYVSLEDLNFQEKRRKERNEEEKYADSISGDLMGDEKWTKLKKY